MPDFAGPANAMMDGSDHPTPDQLKVEGRASFARGPKPPADPSGRRYRFLAKAIPQIVWTASPNGVLDSFNPRWSEYTGLPHRPNQSRNWRNGLHPEDVPRWVEGWRLARTSAKNLALDVRLKRSDGSFRWHLVRASPIRDRSGSLLKWLGTCTDIDDQKRAEGMLGFLAEVSTLLASSLDFETTLAAVARMAVPHVADWCVVDLVEPGGEIRRLAVAHVDPAQVALGWELARLYPPSLGDPGAASRVLQSGLTELAEVVDDEALVASAVDAGHLAMLRGQRCGSTIVAPLAARGRTLGVISFAMAESGRQYSPADLPLVEDLARRSAMAVDNARLYREARQAREEAEAANRAKDRFLAVLSHELRTPLAPILAEVSSLIDDPTIPEHVRPFLEMTRRNVEIETHLIDDLLDLNRILQGKLRLHRRVVDAHRLILESVAICRAGIDEAGLLVEVDLGASRHFIDADPARLQQVVWNLIKNAVKFTPSGGKIVVRSRNEGETLVVEVVDTGVGIEPSALSKIFDAFDQGHQSVTQKFGGLGLGLAIGRSLAEEQGGRLTAASLGPGKGSTFALELPTVPEPVAASVTPSAIESSKSTASLRVLLVEDNFETLRVLDRLLTKRGHSVTTASGVTLALRAAAGNDFDVVVSDLGLDDGNGLDLIRQINQVRPRPIPSLALSGSGMDDDLRRSREAGFLEHLVKPVDFATLEAAMLRVAASNSAPVV
jgi:PAS domain S-box-containing protein